MISSAHDILDKVTKYSKSYTKGIAQVVSSSIFNKARKDGMNKSSKMYPYAQYSAILDSKVCDLCRELDGQIIETADPRYISGIFNPPQHKNCRCLWVYISKYEKNVQPNWTFDVEDMELYRDQAHLKDLRWRGI